MFLWLAVTCNWHMMRKNGQLHPIKGCTYRVERWDRWRAAPKNSLNAEVLRVMTPFPHISPGIWVGENRQVQQTPGSFSSVVMKKVIDQMSSPRGHDSCEQLPPLDCMWDQNDMETSDSPSHWTWFKLKLRCINWLWLIFRITEHLNKQFTLLSFLQNTTK
jgi:hypothetical protein